MSVMKKCNHRVEGAKAVNCNHKFVDSNHCGKCGVHVSELRSSLRPGETGASVAASEFGAVSMPPLIKRNNKMNDVRTLKPGHEWAKCLCAEIDPSDRPCIVCDCWTPETAPPESECKFLQPPHQREDIKK